MNSDAKIDDIYLPVNKILLNVVIFIRILPCRFLYNFQNVFMWIIFQQSSGVRKLLFLYEKEKEAQRDCDFPKVSPGTSHFPRMWESLGKLKALVQRCLSLRRREGLVVPLWCPGRLSSQPMCSRSVPPGNSIYWPLSASCELLRNLIV